MHHRREIDGLRALAVIPVILFHAGFVVTPGGFAGVDVFFVISGYLIGGIIWDELDRGEFSFVRFYERRLRRIVPALLFLLIACVPLAWALLSPEDLRSFASSALATLAFVANYYFLAQTGYFAANAQLQPLLHTWSLAVEEQFYLLFPLLLAVLHRRFGAKGTTWVLIGLAALSLAAGRAASDFPDTTFFLLPYRGWELIAGTLCALALRKANPPSSPLAGLIGIAAVCGSMVWLDATTPFPSLLTLLPVGGAALIILFARGENLPARLLSAPPLVGIGLVSYSAYLWHQPLFAFARAFSVEEPSHLTMALLVGLTLALATFSWRFVEQPFRRGSPRLTFPSALRSLGIGVAAVGATCLAVAAQAGIPSRFDHSRLASYERGRSMSKQAEACKVGYAETRPLVCTVGTDRTPTVRIAVIGDSHASHWLPALRRIGQERGWQFDIYAKGACPIADVAFTYAPLKRRYDECAQWRSALYGELARGRYRFVVVSHAATSYVLYDDRFSLDPAQWREGMALALRHIERTGAEVIVLEDVPRFTRFDPVACTFKTTILVARATECTAPRTEALDSTTRGIDAQLVSADRHRRLIDLTSAVCDALTCRAERAGELLMADSNHLSEHGALLLATPLENALAPIVDGSRAGSSNTLKLATG